MNFGKQQKGLFTFYLEQAQAQLIPNNPRDSFQTSRKLNLRTERSTQSNSLSTLQLQIMKTFKKYKTRNKMYRTFRNKNGSEQSEKKMSQQLKQKNSQSVIAKNQCDKSNFKYKKITGQLSSIKNLKTQLQQLETKKTIETQKSVENESLNTLSIKKKYSQQDLRKTKLNYHYPTIKLEYQILKDSNLVQKYSIDKQLIKKTLLKGCLKSKIRYTQKQNLTSTFKNQKENKQFLRFSQETQPKNLYKQFKRVNNPLKLCNEPLLYPIQSHRNRQFKEYFINFQDYPKQLQGDRSQSKVKQSQNFAIFAAQKQVNCLQLLNQLQQTKY